MVEKLDISEAQLKANQENAQKSTGPRTEEGKKRARINATRHGLKAGRLPPGCKYIEHRINRIRRELESDLKHPLCVGSNGRRLPHSRACRMTSFRRE